MLERLLAACAPYYDVSRGYEFGGRRFAGYAEFRSHAERYVLVERAKLWQADAFEYLFFETCDRLAETVLADLVSFVTSAGLAKVDPDSNHMASYLSLVVIADEVDENARRFARRARWRKNFKLGLEGWADLRLAVIDLSRGDVVANGQGKQMREMLEHGLASV